MGSIMAERIIRDATFRVKVHPETKLRLERISQLYGVPPATLASVWLGQSITQHERNLDIASKMADVIGGEVGAAMKHQLSMMPELYSSGGPDATNGQ
jgi:hypothetical protein